MPIAIYSEPKSDSKISRVNSTDIYTPISFTISGQQGGALIKRVYIRNDDIARYYTDLSLQAIDTSGSGRDDGTLSGWNWKLLIKDVPPTHGEWIEATTTISLTNLGTSSLSDTSTYLSVWIRVEIPQHVPANNILDINLRLTGKERFVG